MSGKPGGALYPMKNVSGFTLIELMIVMIIMGVLAAIGVTSFMSSQIKGRDAQRKGNLKAIAQALELYYNDKSAYPTSDGAGSFVGCYTITGGGPGKCGADYPVFKDSIAGGAVYMAKYPVDPATTQQYYYLASKSSGSAIYNQYQLYAHVENNQDLQRITPAPATAESPSCGTGASCNYGISSGNIQP